MIDMIDMIDIGGMTQSKHCMRGWGWGVVNMDGVERGATRRRRSGA